MDPVYRRSTELVTFIENHDMPRFLSICPCRADLELATVLLLTLRGVPCLFYGTEQYLVDDTCGGHDPYNRPMMVSWDLGTRMANLIRRLADLRRTNRALSYGRHQQNYVSEDLYAYTRRYRDNRVVVIVNKGGDACVDIGSIDLAEGQHRCLLTDRLLSVTQGSLRGLQVPAKGAFVLAVEREPLRATTVVKFQINGDAWFAEVGFDASAGKPIRFRFVVLRPGDGPVRENLICRTFLLPASGSVKLDLDWDRLT